MNGNPRSARALTAELRTFIARVVVPALLAESLREQAAPNRHSAPTGPAA